MKKTNTTRASLLAFTLASLSLSIATEANAFSIGRSYSGGNSNFGGSVSVSAFDSINSSSYTLYANTSATATVVGKAANVASATGALSLYKNKYGVAQLRINAAGVTLVNYVKQFSTSVSFSTATFVKETPTASTLYWAGPVPILVSGSASVSVYGTGSAAVYANGTAIPTLDANFGPVFNAAAKASGKATIIVASAGVQGATNLLRVAFPVRAKLYPSGSAGYCSYGVDWNVTGPSGSLNAFAQVWVPKIGWRNYTYPLWSGAAGSVGGNLASSTSRVW